MHIVSMLADFALVANPAHREAAKLHWSWEKRIVNWGHAEGIIGWLPRTKTCVIAIAGTNDHLDWATNTDVRIRDYEGVEYHEGFFTYADFFAAGAVTCDKWIREAEKIYVTGHSLGGAAALILPEIMSFEPTQIVTFDAPRCLRSDTAARYPFGTAVLRVVKPMDFVPDVPLKIKGPFQYSRISGWSHVGAEWWLLANGRIDTDPSAMWQFMRRARRALRYWGQIGSWRELSAADHDIVTSWQRIKNAERAWYRENPPEW